MKNEAGEMVALRYAAGRLRSQCLLALSLYHFRNLNKQQSPTVIKRNPTALKRSPTDFKLECFDFKINRIDFKIKGVDFKIKRTTFKRGRNVFKIRPIDFFLSNRGAIFWECSLLGAQAARLHLGVHAPRVKNDAGEPPALLQCVPIFLVSIRRIRNKAESTPFVYSPLYLS